MMTRVLIIRILHYSGVNSEAAILPEDASILTVPMLSTILELPHSGNFSTAHDIYGNRSSMTSAFNYTTIIDHL